MDEDGFSERLKRLEERIEATQAARARPEPRHGGEYTKGSLAWRMVIELVVGMLLGLAIGFGLDSLLGTLPWFLLLFALLGFAAGVRTMMRTADEVRHGRAEGALMGKGPEDRAAGRPGAD